ncbi:hypothetical protein NLJ89_g11309 [Agrocybe chaxingu]|uniref:Uncharacterized protein n=1 Tax=Agrocybe chaxingu TaxID=84603 RepID=A0A9W8JQ67_9AGAR|nr:hypothetical protein NLJ89_g11309 [Agrocybe chaxingu]
MNSSYNKDVAVTALEEIYQGRMKEDEQLRTFLVDAELSDYRVQLSNNPPCWRVVKDKDDEAYEAYFRVVGILALSDLPPVKRANPQFVKLLPQEFRPGDIVEATVSFVVVKGKNDVHHMFGILRGLCLLDPTVRQGTGDPADLPIKVVEKPIRVKRKNIYEEEEVEKTMRRKLSISDSH